MKMIMFKNYLNNICLPFGSTNIYMRWNLIVLLFMLSELQLFTLECKSIMNFLLKRIHLILSLIFYLVLCNSILPKIT